MRMISIYFQLGLSSQFNLKIMLIYSVTCNVDEIVENEWVQWMKETHIPEVMQTGKFVSCRFSKLTSHQEEGSQNYSVQYLCTSKEMLEDYKTNFGPHLQKKTLEMFADKVLAFRSELEIIDDF